MFSKFISCLRGDYCLVFKCQGTYADSRKLKYIFGSTYLINQNYIYVYINMPKYIF